MRTFEELEALYQALPPAGPTGRLGMIVSRRSEGVHELLGWARLDVEQGLEGDRWSRGASPARDSQVTLMNGLIARLVAGEDQEPHMAGDNLHVDIDLGTDRLPAGARVRVGAATLEITAAPHTGCKKFAARFGQDALRWINWAGHRERRLRGVNCRVVEGGLIEVGDPVEIVGVAPAEG